MEPRPSCLWFNLKNLAKTWTATFTSRRDFEPCRFADEDWDNLLILDGCRYDAMAQLDPFDAEVERRLSNASHTYGFLKRNFCGDNRDTVYVSATPQIGRFDLDLHGQVDVWADAWNEDLETVHPSEVTREAKRTAENHPDKRLVVHYLQPHYPFIGEETLDLPQYSPRRPGPLDFLVKDRLTAWQHLDAGNVETEDLKKAYLSNLELAVNHVRELLPHLEGRTVITSDHANLYGERVGAVNVTGHGHRWDEEAAVEVPWIEMENGDRKEVKPEKPDPEPETDKNLKQKLRDLGYRT